MKKLLGMANDRKDKQVVKPITNLNFPKNTAPPQQFNLPSQSQQQQDQELNEQQLIAFAQFLGIQLPEEEYLLWIAVEGLNAELPAGWATSEGQEQVVYINTRTGQRTYEHPCDQYYIDLVKKQRRKALGSNMIGKKTAGNSAINQYKIMPGQNVSEISQISGNSKIIPTDPLIKMQQQKQLKKLEEQKKKQFDQKKNAIASKFQQKKNDLAKDLKLKFEKTQSKYQQEERQQRSKQTKKMTDKQKQKQEQMNKQLEKYESDIREKQERAMASKKRTEKQNIERKIRNKKQEIKKQLQEELKLSKKQMDEQYKLKFKQVEENQRKIEADTQGLDLMLERQIKQMKNEIIRKKMGEHSDKIKAQNERQKEIFLKQVNKLQAINDEKISQIQKKQPKNKINMEELVKQCERQEKQQMETFRYELNMLRQAKILENQSKVEDLRSDLLSQNRRKLKEIQKQYEEIFQKYKNLKSQQYENQIWQAEKRAKQEYLKSLKTLEKKFGVQQQLIFMQNKTQTNFQIENEALSNLKRQIDQTSWQEKQSRDQLQNLKLQIDNLRSQNTPIGSKLNQNQLKLYQLIQDKIRNKF